MQQPIVMTIDGDWIERLFGFADKKDQNSILALVEAHEDGLRDHVDEGIRQILLGHIEYLERQQTK